MFPQFLDFCQMTMVVIFFIQLKTPFHCRLTLFLHFSDDLPFFLWLLLRFFSFSWVLMVLLQCAYVGFLFLILVEGYRTVEIDWTDICTRVGLCVTLDPCTSLVSQIQVKAPGSTPTPDPSSSLVAAPNPLEHHPHLKHRLCFFLFGPGLLHCGWGKK